MIDRFRIKSLLGKYKECNEVLRLQNEEWKNESAFGKLIDLKDAIPDELYAACLRIIFTEDTEGVYTNTLISAFQGISMDSLMYEEEIERFRSLPETITVFRGTADANELEPRISWSLKRSVAEFYGTEHLFTADVKKNQVTAFFSVDTDEEEIVILNVREFRKIY